MKLIHFYNTKQKLELFGYGEWIEEPDQAFFEHNSIACEISRNSYGNLCGYCYLPDDHPWNDIKLYDSDVCKVYDGIFYQVGLKIGFTTVCRHDDSSGVDLIPYDFHHEVSTIKAILSDLDSIIRNKERLISLFKDKKYIYRNFQFAEKECKNLADQIVEAYSCV